MWRSVQAKFLALTVPIMAVLFVLLLGLYEWQNYRQACADLERRIERNISSTAGLRNSG